MSSKPLPNRPQWFRDKIAELRADRRSGKIPPDEFLPLAADEAQRHPDYLRTLALDDIGAYDRAVGREQQRRIGLDAATADARHWLQASMLPAEMLEKLGLDPVLDLGWGKDVATLDATGADRAAARKQLETKRSNSSKGIGEKIAALDRLDEIAGAGTLREAIDDAPARYGKAL